MLTLPQLLAIPVLMLAAWPLIRLVSIPSIRREYARVAFIAVAIVASWYAAIAVAAFAGPGLLVPAAVIAAGVLLTERWRARSAYGAKRGLPPGRLSLVPRGPWVDETFYSTLARAHGPVFKMSQFFRPMVCVMGPEHGVELLEQHADSLYSPPVRFSRFIPKGYIRYMAPEDHAVYRPILRAALNRKVLHDCSASFRALIGAGLADAARVSGAAQGGVHPESFISPMTFRCMLRLFLGVDGNADAVRQLSELYRKVEIGKAGSKWHAEDRLAANAIARYIEERMRSAGLSPCVARELHRTAGVKATDPTVLLNLVYMIRVSSSDMAGFLTWAVKMLLDNPEWFSRLRSLSASGRDGEAEELAGLMLREMLRLERSEFIFRKARTDIEYRGFRIPRGWIVRVCIRDGHRDPRTFPDPRTFDPLRFKNRTYGKKEYSPLGIGAHACLGGQLINVLGTVFLTELARSFELLVVADAGREYGRSHWQPGSDLRISLVPRL